MWARELRVREIQLGACGRAQPRYENHGTRILLIGPDADGSNKRWLISCYPIKSERSELLMVFMNLSDRPCVSGSSAPACCPAPTHQ
jgi:hypothetical protein